MVTAHMYLNAHTCPSVGRWSAARETSQFPVTMGNLLYIAPLAGMASCSGYDGTCIAILKSRSKSGQKCGKPAKVGNYCGHPHHRKLAHNDLDPVPLTTPVSPPSPATPPHRSPPTPPSSSQRGKATQPKDKVASTPQQPHNAAGQGPASHRRKRCKPDEPPTDEAPVSKRRGVAKR